MDRKNQPDTKLVIFTGLLIAGCVLGVFVTITLSPYLRMP